MTDHTFKSVTFGGFDKQAVANYIQQISQAHAEQTARLEQERDNLQGENGALRQQLAALQAQTAEQAARLKELQAALEQAEAQAAALKEKEEQVQALSAQVAELKPDAESYRQFRNRIGDIECDARSRAAELEAATNAKLRKVVADFREKYGVLTASFDTASGFITSELRKVEVNLTQLPRALDQIGAQLNELEGTLKGKDD